MRYVTFEMAGHSVVHVHEPPTPYKWFLTGYSRLTSSYLLLSPAFRFPPMRRIFS